MATCILLPNCILLVHSLGFLWNVSKYVDWNTEAILVDGSGENPQSLWTGTQGLQADSNAETPQSMWTGAHRLLADSS